MSPARSRLRPAPAVPPCGRCPAIGVRHPETDAGSAGEQPARDTGVAADDARRGGLAAHAPGRRHPGTPPIGVAPCLRKPWGRRPQGVRGQSPLSSQHGGRPQGGQPFPLLPPGHALTPRRNCKQVVLQLIRHPSPDLTGKTEACRANGVSRTADFTLIRPQSQIWRTLGALAARQKVADVLACEQCFSRWALGRRLYEVGGFKDQRRVLGLAGCLEALNALAAR